MKWGKNIWRQIGEKINRQKYITHRNGSESCPSRGLLFGLLARGHPDKLRCDE